jgi:rSAM/selenodomain-associated transferase 1
MTKTLIKLFAKPPVEGKVKTRLIPDIGEKSATAIYQHCLKSNIKLVKQSAFEYQIWLTEVSDHPLFKNEKVKIQQGNNLGEKMLHALTEALSLHTKVILIGSDCLDLSTSLLKRVCEKLEQHELVFIPALDGGYVLIAAKESIDPNIFKDIEWGSDSVLTQTLERAMQSGIDTAVLNPLRDIDRVDDVQHYAELKQYL